ncbi:MAG: MATE family efflux transporter [Synergistaceae bacterium]|nr:MATE family efflux transporter [Synergistaceae bacterium]
MRRYEFNMTSGRIWTVLLMFTWPLLLENLLQLLYYTADSVIVGRYVGVSALAAVSATTHICGMLVRFFNGTATGAGVVISRAFGANDRQRLTESIKTSLILTLTGCVLLTLFGVSLSRFFLERMSTPPDVIDEADLYLKIYFGGISGLLFYNIGGAILRAMGDTRRPLFFLIVCSVLNIALDLWFVKIGWGIAGVAIATIAAQALSACLVVFTVVKSARLSGKWRIDRDIARMILKIGLPFGIQMAVVAFSNVFVQGYINVFGTAYIAGWGVYMKLDQYMMLPIQSMGQAVTVFTGQNLGAGKHGRAISGTWTALAMMLVISSAISATLCVNAPLMSSFFSPDSKVIEYGTLFIRMCTPIAVITCFTQILSGYLRGDGNSRMPMIITLCTHVFFRQAYLAVITRLIPGNVYVVGFGYPAGWILCALSMTLYYFRWQKRRSGMLTFSQA